MKTLGSLSEVRKRPMVWNKGAKPVFDLYFSSSSSSPAHGHMDKFSDDNLKRTNFLLVIYSLLIKIQKNRRKKMLVWSNYYIKYTFTQSELLLK